MKVKLLNFKSKKNIFNTLENKLKRLLNSELSRDENLSLEFLTNFLKAYRLVKEPANLRDELNNTETDLLNYIHLNFYTKEEIFKKYMELGLKLGTFVRLQELYLQQKQYKQDN